MANREKRRDRRKKKANDRGGKEPDRLIIAKKNVVIKRYRNKKEALREARAMKAYGESPHLVRFHRFFVKRGRGFIVMERIKGRTLCKVIKKKGAMPSTKVIEITLHILEGIKKLHEAGYVHGDLHCNNVMVTSYRDGKIKIIDFQHAVRKKKNGKARARRKLPNPPAALPPESRKRTINDSYDIYGVGFMAACMLRGRLLSKPPRKGDLGPASDLWRVIVKAVHKRPSERYQSAQEMMEALRAIAATVSDEPAADDSGIAAQPVSE